MQAPTNAYKITDIAFETICDGYAWGRYGAFKVILRMRDGYINATKLCAFASTKNGTKKEFYRWQGQIAAQELIEEVSAAHHIRGADMISVLLTGDPHVIRGTYVHPDLIPAIAGWACPKFAYRIVQIVNAYITREAAAENERLGLALA